MNKIEDFTEGSVWSNFNQIFTCIGIDNLRGKPKFKSEKDYGYSPSKEGFSFGTSWKYFKKVQKP